MPNSFRKLEDIADALAGHLEALGTFNEVSYAGISSAVQLFEMIDTLNKPPCAVICLGDINHDAASLSRSIRLVIAVADSYKRSTSKKAAGVWPLVQAVENSFIPDYAAQETTVEIGGVEWNVENIRPVETNDRMTVFMVVVQGVEPLMCVETS